MAETVRPRYIPGPQGIPGPEGPPGPPGVDGEALGLPGPEGPEGPEGPQGVKGDTGLTGNTGPPGEPGIQGIQGLPGGVGLTGSTGSTGLTGSVGLTGSTGLQGVQGIQGLPGTVGLTGSTGQQGLQGIQGIQGLTGIQGTTGQTGLTGSVGLTGSTGPQGIQGVTPTIVTLGSDDAHASALTNVTGMASAVSIGTYRVYLYGRFTMTAGTTPTYKVTFTGPAGTTSLLECRIQTTDAGAFTIVPLLTLGTVATSTAITVSAIQKIVVIEGLLVFTASGTLQLQDQNSGTSAAGALKAGSRLVLEKIA